MRNPIQIAGVLDVIPARQYPLVTADLCRLRGMLEAEHPSDLLRIPMHDRRSQSHLNARTDF
jgi:hypothetical protein